MPATEHPAVQIEVVGQRYPLQVRIAEAGAIVGYGSRGSAYRAAEADDWPLCGPATSRRVLLGPLLTQMGVPFIYVSEKETP